MAAMTMHSREGLPRTKLQMTMGSSRSTVTRVINSPTAILLGNVPEYMTTRGSEEASWSLR